METITKNADLEAEKPTLQAALLDILDGRDIHNINIETVLDDKLTSGAATWDGNVYKYSHKKA